MNERVDEEEEDVRVDHKGTVNERFDDDVDEDQRDVNIEQDNERVESGRDRDANTNVNFDQFDNETDNVDTVRDNDKGQTTDDLEREETPDHFQTREDNETQNRAPLSTESPEKRSIGSQANSPPIRTQDEVVV